MSIAGEEEGTIQVHKVSRPCEQACRSDSQRGADHAAKEEFEAALARALRQQQGFCQPSGFVEFDIDRFIAPNEAWQVGGRMTALIRAHRHGMIQSFQDGICVCRKRLFDEVQPLTGPGRQRYLDNVTATMTR